MRNDDANALIAGAPYDAIAGHQCRQVGAQVAAEDLTACFAFLSLDFDLNTEVSNYKTGLFGAEVAAFQCFKRSGLAFCRAGSTLALNFFDAPVLTTIELAFGHGCSDVM